jgi:putative aldouronate transport system permease protein
MTVMKLVSIYRPAALGGSSRLKRIMRKDIYFYGMLALPLLYLLIFRYIPMSGVILSFRRFASRSGMWGKTWVGFKYFEHFLNNDVFWRAFKNNLILSILSILFSFPVPVVFALLLNEVRNLRFKKLVQTVSYLPHFLSIVVVVGLIKGILSPSIGIVNELITSLGMEPIFFLGEPGWFRPIYIVSDIWQHMGWNAIIYIAALSNIDEQLYEAAMVDGANRWRQTLHVTLPGIAPAVIITLILAVGRMLMIGFEKVLLLYNPGTYETADILSTYVFRMGLEQANFSYGTAVGLFNAVIGLVLVTGSNFAARRFTGTSIY